jgi:hypothetical protein
MPDVPEAAEIADHDGAVTVRINCIERRLVPGSKWLRIHG